MLKHSNLLLKLSLLALIPFGYFFYRDILASGSVASLEPCTPYDIEWDKNEDLNVSLKWKTKDECIGYVKYGLDSSELNSTAVEQGGSKKKKDHEVVIENSKNNKEFYIIFYSGDQTYGSLGLPLQIRID